MSILTLKRASSHLVFLLSALPITAQPWNAVSGLPGYYNSPAIATANDGKLYLIGNGSDHLGGTTNCLASTKVVRYDPILDQSQTTGIAQLNSVNRRCDASAITAPDGRIYVIGGRAGMGPHPVPTNEVLSYDAKSNLWTVEAATLSTPRSKPAVAIGPDRQIYVFGGLDQFGNAINTIERMDPLGPRTWSTLGITLPTGAGWRAAANPAGTIHLLSLTQRYRFNIPGFTFTLLNSTLSSAPFGITAGPDNRFHYADNNGTGTLNSTSLVPFGLPDNLFVWEQKIEMEPAEGGIYAIGSSAEVFGPAPARVANSKILWRFDNSLGTTYCNPGAAMGNPSYVPGKVNRAATFTGANEIRYSTSPCFDVAAGSFSIDFWIRPKSSAAVLQAVIDQRDIYTNKGYHVALYQGKIVLQMNLGNPNYSNFIAPPILPLNEWTHVAIAVSRPTSGASEGFIWINGALGLSFTPKAGSLTNAGPMILGGHTSSSPSLRLLGDLDDLQIHSSALTWHQARAIFLAGREGKQ